MPTPHPRLVLMTALGHDPLENIPLSITPEHLAATPDVLPMLVRKHPMTIQLLFQRNDLPPGQLQELGEVMLAPHKTLYDLPDAYEDTLVLLALAALRDGRLLPTPAIRRHVTALMAAEEEDVASEGPMAALLCAEALGWPLPKNARRIRARWKVDRDYERRMSYQDIRESLSVGGGGGGHTLPTLSFETPWECTHLTARAPVVIGKAPSLSLEEAEAMIIDNTRMLSELRDDLCLVAPPNAPDFWQALPIEGPLLPRYEAIADNHTHGPRLAPVSTETCDRLMQAVDGARRLQDAEPYLRLIRTILAEQPENGLPLYHVLLRAKGRWSSANLPFHVVANCPLTPATHDLWWELVAALFPDGRTNAVDMRVAQYTLLAHRVTFPEQQELRQPPAPILERLWAQGGPEVRILLLDHGVKVPAPVVAEPATAPTAALRRPAGRR